MLESVFRGPGGIRSGWRVLSFIILSAIPFLAIEVLLRAVGPQADLARGIPPSVIIGGESALFLCPLLAAWMMGYLEQKKMGEYGLPARGAFGRQFWAGAWIGFVAMSALMIGIRLRDGFDFGGLALGARGIFYYGVMWAFAFLVVAFAEEFLFRGYVLATLSDGIGFWPAALAMSVIFGAVHLTNFGENPLGALSAGMVGLLFCFSLRRTGSLWFAVGLHAAWDFSESFIYSVPDSGAMVRGHLLNSSFVAGAPAWLTGGSVGPEGSVLVFIVLAVLFIVVHRMYPEVRFRACAAKRALHSPVEPDAALP